MGSAGAAAARVPAIAACDFQMLVGGRRETFLPGEVLQLLADDAVLHSCPAQLPERADSHRRRERTYHPAGRRTLRRLACASVQLAEVPARVRAAECREGPAEGGALAQGFRNPVDR